MGLGTLAVGITHRANAWFEVAAASVKNNYGNERARQIRRLQLVSEDLSRWATVWQFSVQQVCTGSERLHPAARKLLKPRELELYEATPKGRQLVMHRLTQLLMDEGPRALAEVRRRGRERQRGSEEERETQGRRKKKKGNSTNFSTKKNDTQCSSSPSSFPIIDPKVAHDLIRTGNAASGTCTGVKFQALPAAVSFEGGFEFVEFLSFFGQEEKKLTLSPPPFPKLEQQQNHPPDLSHQQRRDAGFPHALSSCIADARARRGRRWGPV